MSITITFNVQDVITGNHLHSIAFNPANGAANSLQNSPFTFSYDAGTYYPTFEVPGYRGKVAIAVVTTEPYAINIPLGELIDVVNKSMIYDNIYMDQPIYSSNNILTSCRVRVYSNPASVGTTNYVIATYTMTATETAGRVLTYKTVKT